MPQDAEILIRLVMCIRDCKVQLLPEAGKFAAAMCTIKLEHNGPFNRSIEDVGKNHKEIKVIQKKSHRVLYKPAERIKSH